MDTPSTTTQPSPIEKVVQFIDERIGLQKLQAKMLNEPVPGGSRWAYVFGSMLLFIFIMQAVTGVLLMFYYRPTGEYAYHDMKYLQFDVPFGMIMRNMHRWGAHAMVIAVWLHMFRVFMTGSYKPPREFNWVVGVLLLTLTLLLSFTGYLLPWDQLAIWAVTVGTNMARATPLLGTEGPFGPTGNAAIGRITSATRRVDWQANWLNATTCAPPSALSATNWSAKSRPGSMP